MARRDDNTGCWYVAVVVPLCILTLFQSHPDIAILIIVIIAIIIIGFVIYIKNK